MNNQNNQNQYSDFPPAPKPKWSTKKKIGVGAAIVLGLGVVGGAIGGGTSGNNSGDSKPAVSAHVEDHANYEVEQQRATTPPEPTYDANPGIPADTIDDMYVDLLNDEGIHASRKTLIEAGRDGVCVLAGGVDNFTELTLIVMETTGFDGSDTGTLIGASFAAYCPEHAHLLDTAMGA